MVQSDSAEGEQKRGKVIICDLKNLARWTECIDGTVFIDFRHYDQWTEENQTST